MPHYSFRTQRGTEKALQYKTLAYIAFKRGPLHGLTILKQKYLFSHCEERFSLQFDSRTEQASCHQIFNTVLIIWSLSGQNHSRCTLMTEGSQSEPGKIKNSSMLTSLLTLIFQVSSANESFFPLSFLKTETVSASLHPTTFRLCCQMMLDYLICHRAMICLGEVSWHFLMVK